MLQSIFSQSRKIKHTSQLALPHLSLSPFPHLRQASTPPTSQPNSTQQRALSTNFSKPLNSPFSLYPHPPTPVTDDNPPSIWDRPDFSHIFKGNKDWVDRMLAEDPQCFTKLKEVQEPKYLLIGCSDSRVGAQEIMGLTQGELFVHRNIANVVPNTDLNVLSVIYYAVVELKVEDIFVLGHYGCGGVRAASDNKDHGLIEHWLRNIRDVARLHQPELSLISCPTLRQRRLVELNVQEQCINLFGNSIIQSQQSRTARPRIHGLTYDIGDGRLRYLDVDFKRELGKYRRIYSVADFERYKPVELRGVIDGIDDGKEGLRKGKVKVNGEKGIRSQSQSQGGVNVNGESKQKQSPGKTIRTQTKNSLKPINNNAARSHAGNITNTNIEAQPILIVIKQPSTSNTPSNSMITPAKALRSIRCKTTDKISDIKLAISELAGVDYSDFYLRDGKGVDITDLHCCGDNGDGGNGDDNDVDGVDSDNDLDTDTTTTLHELGFSGGVGEVEMCLSLGPSPKVGGFKGHGGGRVRGGRIK